MRSAANVAWLVGRPSRSRSQRPPRVRTMTMYQVTDQLHQGRTAYVPGYQIATTVSAWLAELGAHSPLVDDLERAVHVGDWPAAYAIGDHLSVDVAIAT